MALPIRMTRLIEALQLGAGVSGRQRVFFVEESDAIIPDIMRCITRIEAIRRLNMNHDQFDKLVSRGFFPAKYEFNQMAPLFDPSDIDQFWEKLQTNTVEVENVTKPYLSLKSACNAAVCHAHDLFEKLVQGELRSVQRIASRRFLGLHHLGLT